MLERKIREVSWKLVSSQNGSEHPAERSGGNEAASHLDSVSMSRHSIHEEVMVFEAISSVAAFRQISPVPEAKRCLYGHASMFHVDGFMEDGSSS